jgi:hypothetical protein
MPDGSHALGYENNLAELDVDITIDTVPDVANMQSEQFEILAKLAERYPQDVTFDDLLELSPMPNKRSVMEKRKARKEEAQKSQGGQQQMAEQARSSNSPNKAADTEKKHADADLARAKTETELVKPHMDLLNAAQPSSPIPPPGETGASPFAGA